MKYKDIDPVLREVIGCREGMRKMGFSADDLYIEFAGVEGMPGMQVFMTLKPPSGLTFRINCGTVSRHMADTLRDFWPSACEAINSQALAPADLDRIWQECQVYQNKVSFSVALLAKGFKPPRSLH